MKGRTVSIELTSFHSNSTGGGNLPRRLIEEEWGKKLREIVTRKREDYPCLQEVHGVLTFKELLVPPSRQHDAFTDELLKFSEGKVGTLTEKRTYFTDFGSEFPLMQEYLGQLCLTKVGFYMFWDWGHNAAAVGVSELELQTTIAPKLEAPRPHSVDESWLLVYSGSNLSQSMGPQPEVGLLAGHKDLNRALASGPYDKVWVYQYVYNRAFLWQRANGWTEAEVQPRPKSPDTSTIFYTDREGLAYPESLSHYLGGNAPEPIWSKGNRWVLVNRSSVALLCSRKCPGDIIIKTYDAAQALREAGVPVVSGFHSPMEQECLDILLRGTQPVVVVMAKRLTDRSRLPKEWTEPIESGRMLVISPFGDEVKRVTAETARARNEVVAALASAVFVPYADPGGKTEDLCRKVVAWGKPLITLDSPSNAHLVKLGAKAVTAEGVAAVWGEVGHQNGEGHAGQT